MAGILDNLDYTIEILKEEKRLFLENKNLLEKESTKLGELSTIFTNFNTMYKKFSENLNEIETAKASLEDINRMNRRGELTEEMFIIKNSQIKRRIQDSYTSICEDIIPDLKELVNQISIGSAPEEKKKKFEEEKNIEIQKIEKEVKGKSVVEEAIPYLKQLFPVLIKKAITYTTGIPIL